ncbi:MAG: hypothetical protein ACPHEV_05920 [Nitrosopumilus sp.]
MSEKVWIGGIYLKEEGGYEIILKSLTHYEKRLKTIHASPEVKEAAPMIETAKTDIEKFLVDSKIIEPLQQDLEIIEKALECRKSDIEKAETTSDEYFLKLVENLDESKKDLPQIENALKKIKLYSE